MAARAEGWRYVQQASATRNEIAEFPFLRREDLIVLALILSFGLSAILLRQRTADFMGEDAFYADAAQSLLHRGFYGVNGIPETTQPPGLSGILAVLFAIFGYSYAICVGAMAVFETLGFLAVYELLRRRVPRLVAAGICIVLLSSPIYFSWATRFVYPCFAYFFTTIIALLAGEEIDRACSVRSRIIWGVVLTTAVTASLLIATGTIALLGAMSIVLIATAFHDRRLFRTRFQKFLPVLLVGITVQAIWMYRKPAPAEWPLPGYPGSYLQQLKLKNGNYPELGPANWADIPGRTGRNMLAQSDTLANLILRHGVKRTRLAVLIVPIVFISIGWAYSVWNKRGTDLVDWYFAGYQFIYLLWPWEMEARFWLPIAPLACFYIWQGVKGVIFVSRVNPRILGIICFPLAFLLAAWSLHWTHVYRAIGVGDLPDKLMVLVWGIFGGCALWMACTGRSILSDRVLSSIIWWHTTPLGNRGGTPIRLLRYAACVIVLAVILIGVVFDARIGRENLSIRNTGGAERVGTSEVLVAEVEAGVWLRSHTSPDVVVMARHWPTVYHYADRKLVWFAPISDPEILFEGIVKHGVDYIVVVKHDEPYYLPDDDYCFGRLLARYADKLQLVLQKNNLRIFRVEKMLNAGIPETWEMH